MADPSRSKARSAPFRASSSPLIPAALVTSRRASPWRWIAFARTDPELPGALRVLATRYDCSPISGLGMTSISRGPGPRWSIRRAYAARTMLSQHGERAWKWTFVALMYPHVERVPRCCERVRLPRQGASGDEFARFVAPALLDVLGFVPNSTHLPALLKDRAVAIFHVPPFKRVLLEQIPVLGVFGGLGYAENKL